MTGKISKALTRLSDDAKEIVRYVFERVSVKGKHQTNHIFIQERRQGNHTVEPKNIS